MDFNTSIVHSVAEIDQAAWDALGGGKPFSSHRWYRYAEKILSGCRPVYIILSLEGQMLARATFWVIREEPLPLPPGPLRLTAQAIFKRWPLFICRSPLANESGLILPKAPMRAAALEKIIQAAKEKARKYRASFILFDYMKGETTNKSDWPRDFKEVSIPDPGTTMEITWADFEQYLAGLKPKVRKHYRQYLREAEEGGIIIKCQENMAAADAALALIRNVERRHRSLPNPWVTSLLENAPLDGARWLTAWQADRMIGCELILADNGTQLVTSLGMAEDHPHVYFLLGYADIRHAIEHKMKFLNWGSGAFETKQRLGFDAEMNNFVQVHGCTFAARMVAGWV